MPNIRDSGVGGQPGTYTSTGTTIHALDDVVAVPEGPARVGARAHGDAPLGVRHLLVDALEHGRHLDGHGARDDHQVGVARRGPRDHPEALDVEARRERGHHLDRAAGQPERHRPHRGLTRPVEELARGGYREPPAREVLEPVPESRDRVRDLVAVRPLLVVLDPLLEVLDLLPGRGGITGSGGFISTRGSLRGRHRASRAQGSGGRGAWGRRPPSPAPGGPAPTGTGTPPGRRTR